MSDFQIISCADWGAAPPKQKIVLVGRPVRVIDHGTDGHAPPGSDPRQSGMAYARALQHSHFGRGWIDSGHNFLVTRDGVILEGRHGSLAAIKAGRMVESAHCPGQNDQPGIEHEHFGSDEGLTDVQKQASIWLHALICRSTGIRPTDFFPHKQFFSTDCPTAHIEQWLPELRLRTAAALTAEPAKKQWPVPLPSWFWGWAKWKLNGGVGARPADAPLPIPGWAWKRLSALVAGRH